MLKQYLSEETMQHKMSVDNWEEAIAIAARPLLNNGVIDDTYVEAMIESVEKNGPYIVLKDYFALPHAQAGKGVNKVGMSLLTLEESVDLKGNEVKVFLVLAAVDASAHLGALSQVSELLMDDEKFEIVLKGDLEKIRQLIEEGN